MTGTITILGCGSSGGVPRLGFGWGSCDPHEPKNRRRRCSVLVERVLDGKKTTVIIDTSPDLREQLLSSKTTRLDAVLFTHDHADHVHGIDDVRPYALLQRQRLPVYMDPVTAKSIKKRFSYVFETMEGSDYPPIVEEFPLHIGHKTEIAGEGGPITFLPFLLEHGPVPALGFRINHVAYTPDVNAIPEQSLEALRGLDVWIVDALRIPPHPTHFCLEETLHWIEKLAPKRAVLTNMHTDMDYATLCNQLPDHIRPAYDGMVIGF